jgi:hypothetical protein
VAKQLLNGQKIVIVRAEALNISGEFFRAKRMSTLLSRLDPDDLDRLDIITLHVGDLMARSFYRCL